MNTTATRHDQKNQPSTTATRAASDKPHREKTHDAPHQPEAPLSHPNTPKKDANERIAPQTAKSLNNSAKPDMARDTPSPSRTKERPRVQSPLSAPRSDHPWRANYSDVRSENHFQTGDAADTPLFPRSTPTTR